MKKKKLSKTVPQPTISDTSYQMPAVRHSDDPVIPQVFPSVCVLVKNVDSLIHMPVATGLAA